MPDADGRKSPEYFLNLIRQESRGKLKVYLGFAPGVGKTYRMLADARVLRARGIDVVMGYIEPHDRPDVIALEAGLEEVAPHPVSYRGMTLKEVDVGAILARRPASVLIDEIAHTNAPGSKNPKRFQDVEELLAAGIDVITTMNVQHLASCADSVERAVGIQVRERILDEVIVGASQMIYVDVEAAELINRLKAGKIYRPEQAAIAIRNYFLPGNLTRLRRIALMETANLLAKREAR